MRRFFSGRGYFRHLFRAYPVARTTRQLEIIDTELYVVSLDKILDCLLGLYSLCTYVCVIPLFEEDIDSLFTDHSEA